VHDSFPSHSSNSTKANFTLTRLPGRAPDHLRDTLLQPPYMPLGNAGGAHTQCCGVHLLSPTLTVLQSISRSTINRTWAHFRDRVTLKPVSTPLQHGLRFSRYPIPAHPSTSLAVRLPRGRAYGVTTFHLFNKNGLDPAFPPVAELSVYPHCSREQPATCHFGASLSAPLACW
jgi:hypothetical protein